MGCRQIYVMNLDGTEQKPLTTGDKPNYEAVWSPDGTKIAFVSQRDEQNIAQCTETDSCNSEIYVMDADGSHQMRLTNHPAPDRNPIWSPDGKSIAFVSLRDEPNLTTCGFNCNSEIYMMNSDGSHIVRLTNNNNPDVFPVWQPKP
jgi:Tol biopolymer transport system component